MKLNKVKNELMGIMQGRDKETCLDIAERIEDLLTDMPLGVYQDGWDAEDLLDFVESSVAPNLKVLMNKLQKEEDDNRSKNTD
jgi:hypothetical protein